MPVIGTLGHVDHGKSALLRFLTSQEPDRLPEEKRRGMTVDLNFVWLELDSQGTIGFIDVPGHHRLLKNMISGLFGMDGFLFVVAADDGWMPQSEEHLKLCEGLGLSQGIAVVTKSDLVSPDRVEEVEKVVQTKLQAAFKQDFLILRSSLREPERAPLLEALSGLVKTLKPKIPREGARLWVDRVFTPKGIGVVVTGTLSEGTLTVPDEIWVGDALATIRAIEAYGKSVSKVTATSRVALQLSRVGKEQIQRGTLIVSKRIPPSKDTMFDGEWVMGENPKHSTEVSLHLGTRRCVARAFPLKTWVRFKLETPLSVRAGERVIVRSVGEEKLLGVVEVQHGSIGLSQKKAVEMLEKYTDRIERYAMATLSHRGAVGLVDFVQHSVFLEEDIRIVLSRLAAKVLSSGEYCLMDPWKRVRSYVLNRLAGNGQDVGEETLKQGLLESERSLIGSVLAELVLEGTILKAARGYHIPRQDPVESSKRKKIIGRLKQEGPLSYSQLGAERDFLGKMAKDKEIVSLAGEAFVDNEFYESRRNQVIQVLKERGNASTSDLKNYLGLSRKYAVLLLEQMDRDRVTYLKDGVRKLFL